MTKSKPRPGNDPQMTSELYRDPHLGAHWFGNVWLLDKSCHMRVESVGAGTIARMTDVPVGLSSFCRDTMMESFKEFIFFEWE